MSEKHKISRDMKIVKYSGGWEIISGAAKADGVCGEIWLLLSEIDAIHAYVHKDDAPDPDDVKVAEDGPSCRKCIYHRICKIGHHSSDGCTAYAFIGELGNLLSQVTPNNKHGEWEPESVEVEKLVCGNCDYMDNIDCGRGYCFRYPPTEGDSRVSETTRACGEHRLRE